MEIAKCAGRPDNKSCPQRLTCLRYRMPALPPMQQSWIAPTVKWEPMFACPNHLTEINDD